MYVVMELPSHRLLSKDDAQRTQLLRYLDPEDGAPPRGLPHWVSIPDDFVLALQLALAIEGGATTPSFSPW